MTTSMRPWPGFWLLPFLIAGCGGSSPEAPDVPAALPAAAGHAGALGVSVPVPAAAKAVPAPSARLTTPWTAAALQAAIPLPEYPRPQLVRTDWLNLNGKWSYNGGSAAPDASNPPATAPDFPANPEQILVPYPVESYLSGIQRLNDRNLWYKRTFAVPTNWKNKNVVLNFGAVDRQATVYVNGQKVGQHSGGYDAFSFDITPYLRSGSNELVVGAFDPTDDNDTRGKQTNEPGGIFYTPTSGIWQTVWLEPVAKPHITRLDLIPDLANGRLRITVRGENLAGKKLVAVASSGGTQVARKTGKVDVEFTLPIPNAHVWSPDDPFLYDLHVSVKNPPKTAGATTAGEAADDIVLDTATDATKAAKADAVTSYFGMRSIGMGTIDGIPRPLLNGKYVFQYGPLDQGFWPDGLYTAPTDAALKSDLQAIKDLGLNMVRKHIKVEPQRWFYWADKLGLLVWQDMPDAPNAENDANVAARVRAQDLEIVNEHLSSPAVVTWVIFNESWGDFDEVGMSRQFKAWDPSRLIDTFSGINWAPGDLGGGDLIDLHNYPNPATPAFQPDRIAVLGEFGGNSMQVAGHVWNPASTCCYTLYPDSAALTGVYLAQVDSLREMAGTQGLSAAVYTEISDVEDEQNGFLTYDRQVRKMDFAQLRAAHQALIQGVPFFRRGTPYSLRTVTPGVTDRYLRHAGALGATEVANAGSADGLKQDVSWKVVDGLADASCLSLESVNQPGQFLHPAAGRLRIDANANTEAFRQDATFCPRAALNGGSGLSLESKSQPGYFVRHRDAGAWLDKSDDSIGFRNDASWAQEHGWWHSAVLIPLGQMQSLRVLTPGFDTHYLGHADALGITEIVTSASADLLKQDTTWRVVAGLADASCYSFESRNYPGEYLRHALSRLHRDPLENSDGYRHDATFCAQGTSDGSGGTRFDGVAFPDRFLRHFDSQAWIADGSGGEAWNTPAGYANDTRWSVDAPWAP